MKKNNKIQFIESPRPEFSLQEEEMSSLLGGQAFNCPDRYKDGGVFGSDICTHRYSNNGMCKGSAGSYCGNYASCTFYYA
jgi:hypothetical protein